MMVEGMRVKGPVNESVGCFVYLLCIFLLIFYLFIYLFFGFRGLFLLLQVLIVFWLHQVFIMMIYFFFCFCLCFSHSFFFLFVRENTFSYSCLWSY